MSRFICPTLGSFFVFCSVLAASANTLAIFRTSYGEMAFELFDEDKPVTVRNFILLTEYGLYRNSIINRLEPGFVAQGGTLSVLAPASTNLVNGFGLIPSFGFITNEFATGPVYSNVFGTLAMAKQSGNPDSAANTWFINLGNNSAILDTQNGGFTVFGRLVQGTNVLHAMNTKSNNHGIVNLSGIFGSVVEELPVTYTGAVYPRFNELVYSGIEILKLFVAPNADNSRTLTWNSPTNLPCRIEFSDQGQGGPWSLLHQTNGNGFVQSVIDTNTVVTGRSYRIRIGS